MWQKIVFSAFLLILPASIFAEDNNKELTDHWMRPATAHPASFSLQPEDCGECHEAQYEKWEDSLHAKSVEAGLTSQYDKATDFSFSASCKHCHAPLQAQQEGISDAAGNFVKNKNYDEKLSHTGVGCPSCHVRDGKVYGPPSSEGLKVKSSQQQKGHNGFIEREFFTKAEFCASCHQLEGGYELNEKPLVDTYVEWKKSEWAEAGVQCQDCHMPGREHLFKGIHDKEMTLQALDIEVSRKNKTSVLTVSNIGAGHFFPTYVTPLVVIKAFSLDKAGKVIAGSEKNDFIGRKVTLDLQAEEFDTRIAPGGEHQFEYQATAKDAVRTGFEIWVYPDEFYRMFFQNSVQNEYITNLGLGKKALRNTQNSHYLLWKGEVEVSREKL